MAPNAQSTNSLFQSVQALDIILIRTGLPDWSTARMAVIGGGETLGISFFHHGSEQEWATGFK